MSASWSSRTPTRAVRRSPTRKASRRGRPALSQPAAERPTRRSSSASRALKASPRAGSQGNSSPGIASSSSSPRSSARPSSPARPPPSTSATAWARSASDKPRASRGPCALSAAYAAATKSPAAPPRSRPPRPNSSIASTRRRLRNRCLCGCPVESYRHAACTIEREMRGLRARPRERLLELDEVERRLKPFGRRYLGVREVALDALVGTDGRASSFTRDFRPLHSFSRDRLRSLEEAFADGAFPPIVVVKLGETYFVIDGHHRTALARRAPGRGRHARGRPSRARADLPRGQRAGRGPPGRARRGEQAGALPRAAG